MHVCTKSFLKTTTNSSCVCTHLANKADSDSDSDSDSDTLNYCPNQLLTLNIPVGNPLEIFNLIYFNIFWF